MSKQVYYRSLPPISDEEMSAVTKPETFAVTWLSQFADCPRSGFLARKYRNGAPTQPMIRGSLGHEVWETLTNLLIVSDEPTVPGEVARDVFSDVLKKHPEWVLPPHEVDAVRGMNWNWAEHFRINTGEIFGVEQLWVLELDEALVRGKLDLLLVGDGMAKVTDYKTSLAMKTTEEWEHDFQSMEYPVLLAYGHTEDGVKLPKVDMFESNVVYPRYVFDGRLGERTAYYDRLDVQENLHYLTDLVGKVHTAFDTGRFPAHPGDHCRRCPAKAECPLIANLRNGVGEITTHEEAAAAAEDREFHAAESKRLGAELRAWASDYGPIPYGKDREVALEPQESKSVKWDTMLPALERSVELGEPFDREQHIKRSNSTRTVYRKREAA